LNAPISWVADDADMQSVFSLNPLEKKETIFHEKPGSSSRNIPYCFDTYLSHAFGLFNQLYGC